MVDTKNNIISFGYGDVQVYSSTFKHSIIFRGFKPPVEIGTALDELIENENIEFITEPIEIKFATMKELNEFQKLVNKIDGKNYTQFTYRNYIFDFSNYNPKSIDVMLYSIANVKRYFMHLMAC